MMIDKETEMSKQMSAMDMIYSDPILFVTYRIGVLETRMETLISRSVLSVVAETELACIKEELTTYKHMYELLKKGN